MTDIHLEPVVFSNKTERGTDTGRRELLPRTLLCKVIGQTMDAILIRHLINRFLVEIIPRTVVFGENAIESISHIGRTDSSIKFVECILRRVSTTDQTIIEVITQGIDASSIEFCPVSSTPVVFIEQPTTVELIRSFTEFHFMDTIETTNRNDV